MSSNLGKTSDDAARTKIANAEKEMKQLDNAYTELAADAALTAGSMAPPPFGTVADIASLGKSLFKGDWGGALFDVVGFIPLIGDAIKAAGKGTKIANKMSDISKALKKLRAALARQKRALINGRKAAAKQYWQKIKTKGKKDYKKAIENCSTATCRENFASKKGPQYKNAPKSGKNGSWAGERGDGDWVPKKGSDLDKALKKFNQQNPPLKMDRIPYKDGFPDYTDFAYKTPDGKMARVEIPQQGGSKDFKTSTEAMREMLGDPKWKKPKGYTWHHEPDGVTMTLVPKDLHGFPESPHAGGTSLSKKPDF